MAEGVGLRSLEAARAHRLAPLLAPKSIALVGASRRTGSAGLAMVQMAKGAGYRGRLYPVHPGHDQVDGTPCYPSLSALPETVEHVAIALANHRLEQALAEAIDHGARAATIFASCVLPGEDEPGAARGPLARRLGAMARGAGLAVCGGNTMGFYNLDASLRVSAFPAALDMTPGGVALIAQSGSVFGALANNDRRLKFNLAVTCGAELATTAADYLDWAVAQETTRAVGLFLEAVRDPPGFMAALEAAAERAIPVVALKVGRTAASAAMALSHSGAVAGDAAAYQALFARYGVIQVETLDELAACLLVFSAPKRARPGGLATIHDSGGEREMAADLASQLQVPFAAISEATRAKLAARLEPGLAPENPLDAWGTGHDFEGIFEDCLTALMEDPGTGAGVFFSDLRDENALHQGFARVARKVAAACDKPLVVATNYSLVRHREVALGLTDAGVPMVDGTREALLAVKALFDHRDFQADAGRLAPRLSADRAGAWRARLRPAAALDQIESLALLSDYGIPVVAHRVAGSEPEALEAARALGYPLVLKTAADGIHHKTELAGIHLDLRDEPALTAAYRDLADRLGPKVMVAAMAAGGVEIGLGVINDAQFGPYVMVGAGGVLIELLRDRAFALAPLDRPGARRLLDRLALAPLLQGHRGRPPAAVEALAELIVRLSELAWDLRRSVGEIDINPVIVGPDGCVAVDALVIAKAAR